MRLPQHSFRKKTWAKNAGLFVALTLIFAARLRYGMTKYSGQDEIQVYLIGLKYFTTGIFPYWGPDVVHTESQIPGGLQGLLVGWPIYLFPFPESPYILLNLLSFGAIIYFGWYLSQRVKGIPVWFVYAWLFSAPWLLHYSTHIENPSYVLFAAVLFFTGFLELWPVYSKPVIAPSVAFFQMGFALLWVAQIHLSWVLLLPYIAAVFYRWRGGGRTLVSGILWFLAGAGVGALSLVPVLYRYSGHFSGGVERNIRFHPENLLELPTVFARFLSLACYEVPRFIGHNTQSRLDFLKQNPWVTPFTLILVLAGIIQAAWLAISFFKKKAAPEWPAVRMFALVSVLLVGFSFCFSATQPAAHAFYLMLPVAVWYAFYCYADLFHHKMVSRLAVILLSCGLVFQFALALDNDRKTGLRHSREKIARAIRQKDYSFAGLRRESKFERENREDIWQTTAPSPAGTLLAYTGFEYSDPCFKPQNIVANVRYAGNFACKIDSLQPYSVGFESIRAELKNPGYLKLGCFLKITDVSNLKLVLDIRLDKQTVHWAGIPAINELTPAGVWNKMQYTLKVPPDIPPEARVFLYFWLPDKSAGVSYIDEVTISCTPGAPDH